MCVAAADFIFFIIVLIFQIVNQPDPSSMRRKFGSSDGDHSIPVTWWISIDQLKLEDIIFSLVLDLLGVLGELLMSLHVC